MNQTQISLQLVAARLAEELKNVDGVRGVFVKGSGSSSNGYRYTVAVSVTDLDIFNHIQATHPDLPLSRILVSPGTDATGMFYVEKS